MEAAVGVQALQLDLAVVDRDDANRVPGDRGVFSNWQISQGPIGCFNITAICWHRQAGMLAASVEGARRPFEKGACSKPFGPPCQ